LATPSLQVGHASATDISKTQQTNSGSPAKIVRRANPNVCLNTIAFLVAERS
jgi:hypothetical protein